MNHIKQTRKDKRVVALCGGWGKGDRLVSAALESDCDECRAALNIEPVIRDKAGNAMNVRVSPQWEPKPYANAKSLRRKR